jgi:hypothetical protein
LLPTYLFNAGAKYPLKDNDGLFYLDSKVKFPDVTDGLSNTLLAGETLKGTAGGRRTVQRRHVLLGAGALAGLTEESGVKDFSCGGAGGLSALRGLRDYTNIGMADGSVRVITGQVKLEVWKNLASRNDGNPIPEF